jgi:hypothetical protein
VILVGRDQGRLENAAAVIWEKASDSRKQLEAEVVKLEQILMSQKSQQSSNGTQDVGGSGTGFALPAGYAPWEMDEFVKEGGVALLKGDVSSIGEVERMSKVGAHR